MIPVGVPMTPAELRTAHDAIGVSTEFIAAAIGCHVNMIWRYESPKRGQAVPDKVAEVVRDLVTEFDAAADRLVELAKASEDGALPRFAEIEDFYAAIPSMDGWGERTQGLLVAEAQRRHLTAIEYR